MIIFTTLKQKDLAAVSAQQLFDNYGDPSVIPNKINRYEQYEILGNFSDLELLEKIKSSYIFANPNKHHLITEPDHFNPSDTFFNVSRRTPLNLASKVLALSKLLNNNAVSHVFLSELWSFQIDQSMTANEIKERFILSSSDNLAPFAHPFIHEINMISYDTLGQQLQLTKPIAN